MAENEKRPNRTSLKDRAKKLAKELSDGVADAFESLLPQPDLQPIPVRSGARRRPRR